MESLKHENMEKMGPQKQGKKVKNMEKHVVVVDVTNVKK